MPSRRRIVKSLAMSEKWGIFFTKSQKNSSDFDVPLGMFILTDLFYFGGEILGLQACDYRISFLISDSLDTVRSITTSETENTKMNSATYQQYCDSFGIS